VSEKTKVAKKFSEVFRWWRILTYASPRAAAERYVTILVPFGYVLHAEVVRVERLGIRVQVRAVVRDNRRYRDAGAPRQDIVC